MGFDDSFKIVVSDTQAYKQFGNSLCVPLVTAIAQEMIKTMNSVKIQIEYGQTDNRTQALEYVQNHISRYKTREDFEKHTPQIRIPF